MDEQRFDQLTRSLARGTSRRRVMKGLAGAFAGVAGLRAASDADARTRNPSGTPCSTPRDCASGLCVDGYCCDAACIGVCEACNVAGLEGTCSPVAGAPVGARGPCPGDGGVCSGQCDGVTTAMCAGYPAGETVCGEPTCAEGWQTSSVCSGNGLCVQATTHCGFYGCAADGDACLTECAGHHDCADEAFCVVGACESAICRGLLNACDSADQCCQDEPTGCDISIRNPIHHCCHPIGGSCTFNIDCCVSRDDTRTYSIGCGSDGVCGGDESVCSTGAECISGNCCLSTGSDFGVCCGAVAQCVNGACVGA